MNEFKAITGASEHTATFYLEQSQGDLQEAVEHFFANGGKEAPAVPSAAPPGPAAAAAAAGGGAAGQGRTGQPAARPPAPGNIRGFGDLGGGEDREEDEDETTRTMQAGLRGAQQSCVRSCS